MTFVLFIMQTRCAGRPSVLSSGVGTHAQSAGVRSIGVGGYGAGSSRSREGPFLFLKVFLGSKPPLRERL